MLYARARTDGSKSIVPSDGVRRKKRSIQLASRTRAIIARDLHAAKQTIYAGEFKANTSDYKLSIAFLRDHICIRADARTCLSNFSKKTD